MYKHLSITLLILIFASCLYAEKYEKLMDVKSGQQLKVNMTTGGSVTVEGWDKNQVKVELDVAHSDTDENDIDISQNSKGVNIEVRAEGHGRHYRTPDLLVFVPKKFDLDLQTMGGSIEITDVEGEIDGQTMGGSLKLAGLHGEIGLTTMGGSISVKDSRLDGELKTMGGSIDFDNVTGGITASTMGGSVSMTNKRGTEVKDISEVKISTMGGQIHVDAAPNGADVHTMGGNITVKNARKYVKAKTMGGEIEIAAIDGWVKATTMGGDVSVQMIGDASGPDHSVELSTMGGEIELILPKNIEANFDLHLVYTKDSRQDYEIKSDFEIKIGEKSKDWDYHKGEARKEIIGTGKTGSGKHNIYIKTVNGDITIKKSK
ncbi:MAG: DUF4097 family beta strand repeat protein [Calditrichaceae bacterium]|nr:DUF4097 family beta strand repeat protein [Calditrichaceae bacterium]